MYEPFFWLLRLWRNLSLSADLETERLILSEKLATLSYNFATIYKAISQPFRRRQKSERVNIGSYIYLIKVYKNISYFMLRLHYNIGKIIHKNVNNIFYIQNFGNFKTDFFLNLYLQVFLVKQVSSKNCSFYGLPLCHLH